MELLHSYSSQLGGEEAVFSFYRVYAEKDNETYFIVEVNTTEGTHQYKMRVNYENGSDGAFKFVGMVPYALREIETELSDIIYQYDLMSGD